MLQYAKNAWALDLIASEMPDEILRKAYDLFEPLQERIRNLPEDHRLEMENFIITVDV